MAGEEEQIESLKKWWSEYGKGIAAGVVVGLVSVGGWSAWQSYRNDRAERASVEYQEMIEDIAEGENDKVLARAETFFDEYPSSPYTSLASLLAAKAAARDDDIEQARTHLQRAIDRTVLPEVDTIARIQMARLQIDADDFPAALATLDTIGSEHFRSIVIELRGDAQRLSGDHDAARASYRSLLDEDLDEDEALAADVSRRLNAKIDDLGRISEALSMDDSSSGDSSSGDSSSDDSSSDDSSSDDSSSDDSSSDDSSSGDPSSDDSSSGDSSAGDSSSDDSSSGDSSSGDSSSDDSSSGDSSSGDSSSGDSSSGDSSSGDSSSGDSSSDDSSSDDSSSDDSSSGDSSSGDSSSGDSSSGDSSSGDSSSGDSSSGADDSRTAGEDAPTDDDPSSSVDG